MQRPSGGQGPYGGFRTTGAIMQSLARLDPSVGGAVLLPGQGFLGHRRNM